MALQRNREALPRVGAEALGSGIAHHSEVSAVMPSMDALSEWTVRMPINRVGSAAAWSKLSTWAQVGW